MRYAVITCIGLFFAVGFTIFYVIVVPRLVDSGSQAQIFYILLIPWALSCAAFLFGAMKSYARFTHNHFGSYLELGGPVVLFALVILGGFKLVPTPPETFDLTVRPRSADSGDPFITSGRIVIDLDNNRQVQLINPNGEADFKGIPSKFRGVTIEVIPQIEGYEEKPQYPRLVGDVLNLTLEKAAPRLTTLKGSVFPPPRKGQEIQIVVDGQKAETFSDELGRFELNMNGKEGDKIRLKAYSEGKLLYDDFQILPGPVILRLHQLR
jgi:hypothetical protein